MRKAVIVAAFSALAAGGSLRADEVLFNNGDRLTGKIESLADGKMTIATAVAGKVTLDMKNVKTFSSDAPLAIRLKDKTAVNQKVNTAPLGQIALAPGGTLQPQNIPISSIKDVNYKESWTGNLAVGGALVRGNTESETLTMSAHATRRTETDRITADAGYLYGRQRFFQTTAAGTTSHVAETENDWFAQAKYDYFFTKKFYGYVNARVERDVIAGISLRVTPGAGVGYDFFDRPDFHLHAEGGLSWLYRDYTHDGSDESVAARLAYHVDKKLNDKVTVFHDMEFFPGLDSINDYYFNTDAGVRTSLTEKMFAELKVQENYDQRPAPGKGYNDTRFIVSVGWAF